LGKKVKIAITIDQDVLSEVDGRVRERQLEELKSRKRTITNRSQLVEEFVKRSLAARKVNRLYRE
jgi:metal-responsive CopG/Arc/MetJ family transcriptional regulator